MKLLGEQKVKIIKFAPCMKERPVVRARENRCPYMINLWKLNQMKGLIIESDQAWQLSMA